MTPHNIIVIAPYEYNEESSRRLAHGIKDGDEEQIREAARLMQFAVPKGATLIPVPNASGKAVTTLALANALAQFVQGVTVIDCLSATPRKRLYDIKAGGSSVRKMDLGMKLKRSIPVNENTYLIDNCVDTGKTALEAAKATGIYKIAALAISAKKCRIPHSWIRCYAEAPRYATAYKVVEYRKGDLYAPLFPGHLHPMHRWQHARDIEPFNRDEIDRAQRNVPFFLRHYKVHAGGARCFLKRETDIAYRPGFHLYELPFCTQFNTIVKGKRTKQLHKNLRWVEVAYDTYRDHTEESDSRTFHKADGRSSIRKIYTMAGKNGLPTDGFYKYRESADPSSPVCIVADRIRIVRVLSDADIRNILSNNGR